VHEEMLFCHPLNQFGTFLGPWTYTWSLRGREMIGYKSNLQYCVLVEECEIKLKLGVEIFNFLWARCSLWCIGLREYIIVRLYWQLLGPFCWSKSNVMGFGRCCLSFIWGRIRNWLWTLFFFFYFFFFHFFFFNFINRF
jgi:hypothetical protein